MDVEAYRAALAAHLNIDLQGLQAVERVGAVARSDARAKAMLDRIDEHMEIFEELPKQKAADDNERELAKWIHNVTTGQNELSDEHRARFDALVNRSAQQKQTAQDRVLDVKAFVKEHGRAPHSGRPDASPQERELARWIGNVRDRGFVGLDERLRAELEVAIDSEYIQLCAFEAWCEKNQRMPREKAEDDEERKLANFAANRERGGRPSHTVFNALDTFEQLRERFANKEAARRAARERAAQVQRAEECRREQLCLLYTSPSPRDQRGSRMPSSA